MTTIRVMVVDDAVGLGKAMADALNRDEHIDVVGIALDGKQAVEMGIVLAPDVVVMDMRMPNMDGLAATRALLAQMSNMAVIMHSAYQDESLIEEARRSGARGFVIKGSPPAVLQAAISRAVSAEPGEWFVAS
jgi:DNA-binding NarL/FixJ family response regulator